MGRRDLGVGRAGSAARLGFGTLPSLPRSRSADGGVDLSSDAMEAEVGGAVCPRDGRRRGREASDSGKRAEEPRERKEMERGGG